ncbi:Flp pilus assembly protein CpaB [Moritella sp. 5]|uniref:Flp pilus assembly protein CpaB n=1 Tax=Moritella sp. 5 TaxID=2746231 RepID=UPI001BA6F8F1|nr:Flp pilus assembly protein CpaB [Moritella sp. 5]QUM81969.1 Flp pilus assembly protein CpaB [Moritella sp. 5]
MKSKIILSLAIGLIIMGLYGIAGSLSNAENKAAVTREQVEQADKIKSWWLKKDVDRGDTVTRSDLEIRYLSESEANQNGIDAEMTINFSSGGVYGQKYPKRTLLFSDMIVLPQDPRYIELVLAPDRVPYFLSVPVGAIVGGAMNNGMHVDIVALTLPQSRMEGSTGVKSARRFGVNPVLLNIKVLNVIEQVTVEKGRIDTVPSSVDIVLELTRKQVAKLTVAKRISEIEVHKSVGDYTAGDLKADAGDVLADFKSITEMRADRVVVK